MATDRNSKEHELPGLLGEIRRKFPEERPTVSKIVRFLALSFTPDQAIAIGAAIFSAWAWLFPRDPSDTARCKVIRPARGTVCGAKFISSEPHEKGVLMVCANHHPSLIKMAWRRDGPRIR